MTVKMNASLLALSILGGAALIATGIGACQPVDNAAKTAKEVSAQNHELSSTGANAGESSPDELKVMTPDWGIAATLTAMGYPPYAAGDIQAYPDWVSEPKLPSEVIDMGARYQPNPELLAQLPLDLIIDNAFYEHLHPMYGDIPTAQAMFDNEQKVATWAHFVEPTLALGDIIGQPQAAAEYIKQSEQRIKQAGESFQHYHPSMTQVAVVQFSDAKSMRMYTDNSLFKPTLEMMDIRLQSLGEGNQWGFLPIGLADLATLDEGTCLVVIEPFSPMLQAELEANILWQRLGYGSTRCLTVLPPFWILGGVPSMVTFAERLQHASFIGGQS